MQYDFEIRKLTKEFYEHRVKNSWNEVLQKEGRCYNCVIVDTYYDFFICIPFRSEMNHDFGYRFKTSARSRKNKSAIDYSKIVLIEKYEEYISNKPAIVDHDEYIEFVKNSKKIISEAIKYMEDYVKFRNEDEKQHSISDLRKFKYTSLKYFDDILKKYKLIKD